ncbi:EamA family transporter [Ectobacillus ponti]|uniref:EamA family transporter n=1 Tax=Ectobacillus ponti TaxID=2961894 RepID=A0AA41XC45_9BACI|nr:EamA family transporter [Ectobacillus ponti]MCP8969316.1 EamA family transporter [Ectobacillus ponti]
MSIGLAFLAALFAALTTVLAKMGIQNVDSNLATAIRTIVVVCMASLIVLATGRWDSLFAVSGTSLLYLVLSGITTGLSWICFFRAIQIGDVSKVVPIDKFSTVMTILLAFLILHEPITPLVFVGGFLITIGTLMLIGRKPDAPAQRKKATQSYLLLAVLSAFFAAATSILAKIGIEAVDSNAATLIRTVVILFFIWAIVFFQGTYREVRNITKKSFWFLVLSGCATGLSWLCYFAALAMGKVSIVAPIDKFSVVITMVLSFLVLKEKASKRTILAGVVITAGTVVLIV